MMPDSVIIAECGFPESKRKHYTVTWMSLKNPRTEKNFLSGDRRRIKVIDEAKKLLNPDEKEEKEVFLQEEKKKEKKMRIQTQSRNS